MNRIQAAFILAAATACAAAMAQGTGGAGGTSGGGSTGGGTGGPTPMETDAASQPAGHMMSNRAKGSAWHASAPASGASVPFKTGGK